MAPKYSNSNQRIVSKRCGGNWPATRLRLRLVPITLLRFQICCAAYAHLIRVSGRLKY